MKRGRKKIKAPRGGIVITPDCEALIGEDADIEVLVYLLKETIRALRAHQVNQLQREELTHE